MEAETVSPRASSSSLRVKENGDTTPDGSFDLPSLQPLSHAHPLLTSPDFDVDTFLLSRIYIPLEELRAELREYLGSLREELVQLINDDYEEFISLGTGLRGEGDRLRSIQQPLNELCGEVEGVRDTLRTHQDAIQEKLDERSSLREEKALLDLLQRLFDTLTRAETLLNSDSDRSKVVQRVAGEYTQLLYLLQKAQGEGCKIVDTIQPRIELIKSRLSSALSTLLLEAIEDSSEKYLRQILKTYESIEACEDAAEVVRRSFTSFCKETIVPSALQSSNVPIVPETPSTPVMSFNLNHTPITGRLPEDTPLATLYNKVIAQVEKYAPLLAVSTEISHQFDFYVGVIWPEVAESIMNNLGSVIFTAGRPDELHRHYSVTHDFITQFESLAPSIQAISDLRSSSAYEALERRWQLPVYFQLRWKEIVSAFETALSSTSTAGEGDWSLGQTAAAWKAISLCWDKGVYLPELAPRFWRLNLQIMSRYATWAKSKMEEGGNDESAEEQSLRFAASVISDLDQLQKRASSIPQVTENSLLEHLNIPSEVFSDKVIDILTRRCTDTLKLVRSVASQFRASPSKSTEVTPSYFIPSILKPLHQFFASRPQLSEQYGVSWSTQVVEAVCASYAGILAGVRKTEDLLRRHRKSKKGGFSLFGGGSSNSSSQEDTGEEDRFKKQMQADIQALKEDARKLGVDIDGLRGWQELVEVVNRPSE